MTSRIFLLLAAFQFKHFLADYPLQTPYMLGKFKDNGWILPLSAHAGVHALLTGIIVDIYISQLDVVKSFYTLLFTVALAALDFVLHFTMDRIKASPKLMGRWKALASDEFIDIAGRQASGYSVYEYWFAQQARNKDDHMLRSNTYFWWALGFDQMFHHFTHYLIISLLLWAT